MTGSRICHHSTTLAESLIISFRAQQSVLQHLVISHINIADMISRCDGTDMAL